MERKAKQKVIEELEAKLKRASAIFLAEYSGMNVAQTTRLRRELNNAGGEFKVVKNTLLTIASKGTSAEALKDEFAGPNAIIYSFKDPAAVAKVMSSVTKDMPSLKIKSGLLGIRRMNAQEVAVLATLPPKEVLVGKLAGFMLGFPQRLVGTLAANLVQLMLILTAIKSKKETM